MVELLRLDDPLQRGFYEIECVKAGWSVRELKHDFRDYMLSFLFLRYLSDNYVEAARKELGSDYPEWR